MASKVEHTAAGIKKLIFLDPKIICQKKKDPKHMISESKRKNPTPKLCVYCIPSNSVMLGGIQEQVIGSGGQRIRRRQDQDELVKYAIIVVDPSVKPFFDHARTYNPWLV